MVEFFVRVNGTGHAFSRELGCRCGRCRAIDFAPTAATGRLETFAGWNDPPNRAHTSASILVPDTRTAVRSHILIDVGEGVVDSLGSSDLDGLDNLDGLLISHWHPDHLLGTNHLCESLRRATKAKGRPVGKIPLFCTRETYDYLAGKFSYEAQAFLEFREIASGQPFKVREDSPIDFMPIGVAHGLGGGLCKNAVIFVATASASRKRVVFGWDIDVPDAKRPLDGHTNIDVIRENRAALSGAELYFLPANTWAATGTGHTSLLAAQQYINECHANRVLLLHMSGHEDGVGNAGYGWSDVEWADNVGARGLEVARQGMLIAV